MTLIRIDPKRAGPTAFGVLIPHGAKTLVILRPRALEWDLLPARWDDQREHAPEFCAFARDEAAGVARKLVAALEAAVADGVCPVQTFGDPVGRQLQVWLRAAELVWIVCQRTPGQAYQPMIFHTLEEATSAGEKIAAIVWPNEDAKQEYYVNTQNLE